MAFRCQRLVFRLRPGCIKSKLLEQSKCQPALSASALQVANLTSCQSHGNEIKLAKPFPYEKRPYTQLWQFFDHTRKRFNDNSKVIIVDGNLATGKSEFAQKIASEFGMRFFPDSSDEYVFLSDSGFDVRTLNEQLPPGARALDINTFHMQNEHPDALKTIGRTQLAIYRHRFYNYVAALEHLLNTGQGVVVERGPWSDVVFADALKKHGYMSPKGLNYYNQWRDNSVCELWKPHVVIYLDAPVSVIRQNINKRNNTKMVEEEMIMETLEIVQNMPAEVKGKVVTDDYITTIENVYKKKMLPYYSKYCKVINVDLTDKPEWEIIVEDLENLDLDHHPPENETLFQDWMKTREDDWNHYRCILASKWQLENLFRLPLPWDAPEMMIGGEDFQEFLKIVEGHPEVKYAPGYNPEKFNTLLKL